MHIHRKDNKPLSITFIQAVSIQFISDRLLFPPTFIFHYIEKDHLGYIDIEADRVQFEQCKFNSNGNRDIDANDLAVEVVLHVRTKSPRITYISRPGVIHAVHRRRIKTTLATDIKNEQDNRTYRHGLDLGCV